MRTCRSDSCLCSFIASAMQSTDISNSFATIGLDCNSISLVCYWIIRKANSVTHPSSFKVPLRINFCSRLSRLHPNFTSELSVRVLNLSLAALSNTSTICDMSS